MDIGTQPTCVVSGLDGGLFDFASFGSVLGVCDETPEWMIPSVPNTALGWARTVQGSNPQFQGEWKIRTRRNTSGGRE